MFRPVLAALALGGLAVAAAAQNELTATGGVVRVLDKIAGETVDFDLAEGESARMGRITVSLGQCRYPADDPASNAYAWITVADDLVASGPVFAGWMIADSPALNALEHPRYDVWIIRCRIPGSGGG